MLNSTAGGWWGVECGGGGETALFPAARPASEKEFFFFFKQIFSAKVARAPQTHPVALSPFGGVGAWEWGVGGN